MELVGIVLGNLIVASRRHKAAEMFSRLVDRQLRDIGLDRDDIPGHVDATMPWLSREARQLSPVAKPSLQGLS